MPCSPSTRDRRKLFSVPVAPARKDLEAARAGELDASVVTIGKEHRVALEEPRPKEVLEIGARKIGDGFSFLAPFIGRVAM